MSSTDRKFSMIKVGPHLLRHARAQAMVNAGMRLDVLPTIPDHEGISATRRGYAQHTPDAIAIDQLAPDAKTGAASKSASCVIIGWGGLR